MSAIDATRILQIPGKLITGRGCLSTVATQARTLQASSALLFTDSGVERLGCAAQVRCLLGPAGVACATFATIMPDPDLATVRLAHSVLTSGVFDLVIGLGGGSVLDVAKMVSRLGYHGDLVSLEQGRFPDSGLPLILIPTTAGTGSEVSPVIVFKDENGTKKGIWHSRLLAEVALVDPALTDTLPPDLTAGTGADALAHAVEAYLARGSSPFTDAQALHAIKLIGRSLRTAYAAGKSNPDARDGMAYAALLAGIAFSNAGLGAAHALGYPLALEYKVPHGSSVAAFLPWVMEFNRPVTEERLGHVAVALGAKSISAADAVRALLDDIHLPTRLRDYGVPQEKAAALGSKAVPPGQRLLSTNPRSMSEDEAAQLAEKAW